MLPVYTVFLCLLRVEGPQEGQGLLRTLTPPHCLYQVSVNPAYQAMELEYTLKKVGPAPGVGPGKGGSGVPEGCQGGEGMHKWATPRVCPSPPLCGWEERVVGGGACVRWCVCVLGLVHVNVLEVLCKSVGVCVC